MDVKCVPWFDLSCFAFVCLDDFKPVCSSTGLMYSQKPGVWQGRRQQFTHMQTLSFYRTRSWPICTEPMNRGSNVTLPHFYFNFIFLLSTFPEMEVLFLLYFLVPFLNNVLYGCILHVYWICHMRFGSCQSFWNKTILSKFFSMFPDAYYAYPVVALHRRESFKNQSLVNVSVFG